MMKLHASIASAALLLGLACPGLVAAADNKISKDLASVDVMHNGQKVTITRGHDLHATIPEAFQKTDRGCPPFCVEPMRLMPGVETIGELEVLGYLKRMGEGDSSVLVVDSRTPDWVMRGTIPGSVSVPWTKINDDATGTFETPTESASVAHILVDQFGAAKTASGWDFGKAKTLVLFCNGIWCPQSSLNIKTLVKLGYPVEKIKWYRGGMQDWFSVGLTTVKP
jgi:rhodanese-related sulfurtransferase